MREYSSEKIPNHVCMMHKNKNHIPESNFNGVLLKAVLPTFMY